MEEISGWKEQVKLLTDLKVGSLHENMTDMKEDLHDIKNIVMMTNNSKPHISTSSQPSYSAAAKKFNSYNSPSNSKNSSDYNNARPGLAFGQTALVKNKPG